MKCPACLSALSSVQANNLVVDVCNTGCGGLWLDKGELQKVDETHEIVPHAMLRPLKIQQVVVDHNKPRKCPKCVGETLSRCFFDPQKNVEVDECHRCGGFWLDLGELIQIRDQNHNTQVREKNYNDFVQKHSNGSGVNSLPRSVQAVFRLLF